MIDDEGKILDVTNSKLNDAEKLSGIIVPGFINAHCHLELSHLKGKVSKQKGLAGFISELVPKRGTFSPEEIKSAIVSTEEEMIKNGIVAVGDISNAEDSFEQKKKENLFYHTFIEIFDLIPEKAEEKISEAKSLISKFKSPNASITPHAPYSVSEKLMERIDNLKQSFISIHNQESEFENELFSSGSGALAEFMQKAGVDIDAKRRAKNSLLFTLGSMIETKKILLVHNTYTSKNDVALMKEYMRAGEINITLCLCPNANLYIENKLPDIPIFVEEEMNICIGTDSLASNDSLSILDEMKTIQKRFPKISFETLLQWATKNGAEFFGMEKELGTIEKGKTPGLNLLKGMNENFQLSEKTSVTKII